MLSILSARKGSVVRMSGRRQLYVSGLVLLIACGAGTAMVRTAHNRSDNAGTPDVLGVQSGSVGNTAARTNNSGSNVLGLGQAFGADGAGPATGRQNTAGHTSTTRSAGTVRHNPTAAPDAAGSSTAAQVSGGYGGSGDQTDYKEHPPQESVASGPAPVGVPTPVTPYIVGRRSIEIPLGSNEPWTDVFKTSDDSPVTWQSTQADPIFWEGTSVGLPSAPAYMILSGSPDTASAVLPYKVIVNDVVAQPGDTVIFTLRAAETDQSVELQVTIAP